VERTLLALPWGQVEVQRGGDGSPVVVLHRDLGPLRWGALHEALAADHDVWAPSLPGFGGSDLPTWARSVAHLAALTGVLIDSAIGQPVDVVGLGFGGWVAATLAATSPGRVRRLALVSPMGIRPDVGEVVDQFLYGAADYARLGFADDEAFARAVGSPDDDEVAARLDRSREAVTRVAWKPIGHDRALPGLLSAGDGRPALVVWGGADAVVPAATVRRWAEVLVTSTVVEIPGAGHHVEVERPAEVAAAVRGLLAGAGPAAPINGNGNGGRPCS
jgi:pimeloyl-ACP methyl ester carboxylesterase